MLCLLAAACVSTSLSPATGQQRPLEIHSTALSLNRDDPAAETIGQLRWRGGIAMTASASGFGSWSDLHVSDDGRGLTSISDQGAWLTATIDYDAKGNLAGLSKGMMGALRGLDGHPLDDKAWADAEGMARLDDGSWLVAFERNHRIWRYRTLDATPVAIKGPPGLSLQPKNGGIEAITTLADGRIVAISEEYSLKPGTVVGWIGEPTTSGYVWRTFDYVTEPDFQPTTITRLPDGSLATIERAFDVVRGVRCRVMRFNAASLGSGSTVHPKELARLVPPYAVDNLEGMAATRGPRGETLLWLMSDDNFNPMQRNILLLFELLAP